MLSVFSKIQIFLFCWHFQSWGWTPAWKGRGETKEAEGSPDVPLAWLSFFLCLRWVTNLVQKESFLCPPLKGLRLPGSRGLSVESEMRGVRVCVCACVCACVCMHACVLGRGQERRPEGDWGQCLPVGPDKESLEDVTGFASSQLQGWGSTNKGGSISVFHEVAWPTGFQRMVPGPLTFCPPQPNQPLCPHVFVFTWKYLSQSVVPNLWPTYLWGS